ncbi:MAG: hypothetical protein KJ904_12550 [Alphaproteobacteria bacterium]|nr:hypothetical protein [Alphaproteobacteria bacterium]MBU0797685.1 hypothetical protein [Alphaproteobacteria bacterium]MBU0887982.1 hypothetical protein [Alphaproteobacteria bacterium]MBU1811659.1 hypothetical protein [Alphaproteobacteria bacterium]MBU2092234.1 hypothetical protein [Alphaproteobacteria bacterium]
MPVRALKISIAIMTTLLIVGIAVIAVELSKRASGKRAEEVQVALPGQMLSGQPLASFDATTVPLPPRTTLRQIIPAGERAILHLDGPLGSDVLMVLDMATGRMLGSITLEPTR